jgi:hypothetical protein
VDSGSTSPLRRRESFCGRLVCRCFGRVLSHVLKRHKIAPPRARPLAIS